MIGKFSDILNEAQGLNDNIAIVIDDSTDSKKWVYLMNRDKPTTPINKKKIGILDNKNNFTVAFKGYANENFGSLLNFLKNSMFANSLDEAKARLKKEKKYLDKIIDTPEE